MLCDKWFICTEKSETCFCGTTHPYVQEDKKIYTPRDMIESCHQLNWVTQNSHVAEYNWEKDASQLEGETAEVPIELLNGPFLF